MKRSSSKREFSCVLLRAVPALLLTIRGRCILDDGFKHSLIVYEDKCTGGRRIHVAVWEGELRQCPVWTAFGELQLPLSSTSSQDESFANKSLIVTHQSASPTWLKRVSRKRIRLADLQLYVFCQQYRQQSQRKGSGGSFELQFYSEEGMISTLLFPYIFRVSERINPLIAFK